MKITNKHQKILLTVLNVTQREGSLGGATWLEIGAIGSMDRTLAAMVKHGYLEFFKTMQEERLTSYRYKGHDLYRIGPKGAAYLIDIFTSQEKISLETRVARRLKGILPENIKKAIGKDDTHLPFSCKDLIEEVLILT